MSESEKGAQPIPFPEEPAPASGATATEEPAKEGKKRRSRPAASDNSGGGGLNLSELSKIQTVAKKFGGVAELKRKCDVILKLDEAK